MRLNIKGILGSAAMASLIATTMGGGAYADERPGDVHEAAPENAYLFPTLTIDFANRLPEGEKDTLEKPNHRLYRFHLVGPDGDQKRIGYGSPLAVLFSLVVQAAGRGGLTERDGLKLDIKKNGVNFVSGGWVVDVPPDAKELVARMDAALCDLSKKIEGFDVSTDDVLFDTHNFADLIALKNGSAFIYPFMLGAVIDGDGLLTSPKFESAAAVGPEGVSYNQRATAILKYVCYILDDKVTRGGVANVDFGAAKRIMTSSKITIDTKRLKEVINLATNNGWTELTDELLGRGWAAEEPPVGPEPQADQPRPETGGEEEVGIDHFAILDAIREKNIKVPGNFAEAVQNLLEGDGAINAAMEGNGDLVTYYDGAADAIGLLGTLVLEQKKEIDELKGQLAAARGTGGAPAGVADLEQKIKDLEAENATLDAQKRLAEKEAATAKVAASSADTIQGQLDALRREYGELQQELRKVRGELTKKEDSLTAASNAIEQREDDLRLKDAEIEKLKADMRRLQDQVNVRRSQAPNPPFASFGETDFPDPDGEEDQEDEPKGKTEPPKPTAERETAGKAKTSVRTPKRRGPSGSAAAQPPKDSAAAQPPRDSAATQPPKDSAAAQPPRDSAATQPPKTATGGAGTAKTSVRVPKSRRKS